MDFVCSERSWCQSSVRKTLPFTWPVRTTGQAKRPNWPPRQRKSTRSSSAPMRHERYDSVESIYYFAVSANLVANVDSKLISFVPQVNLDHATKEITKENVRHPSPSCFNLAQDKIYTLMEKDCYPRFLRSTVYLELTRTPKTG